MFKQILFCRSLEIGKILKVNLTKKRFHVQYFRTKPLNGYYRMNLSGLSIKNYRYY